MSFDIELAPTPDSEQKDVQKCKKVERHPRFHPPRLLQKLAHPGDTLLPPFGDGAVIGTKDRLPSWSLLRHSYKPCIGDLRQRPQRRRSLNHD